MFSGLSPTKLFGLWKAKLTIASGTTFTEAASVVHWQQRKYLRSIFKFNEQGTSLGENFLERIKQKKLNFHGLTFLRKKPKWGRESLAPTEDRDVLFQPRCLQTYPSMSVTFSYIYWLYYIVTQCRMLSHLREVEKSFQKWTSQNFSGLLLPPHLQWNFVPSKTKFILVNPLLLLENVGKRHIFGCNNISSIDPCNT